MILFAGTELTQSGRSWKWYRVRANETVHYDVLLPWYWFRVQGVGSCSVFGVGTGTVRLLSTLVLVHGVRWWKWYRVQGVGTNRESNGKNDSRKSVQCS